LHILPAFGTFADSNQYSDASKLLAFYQIWLDDLFPKAAFPDALKMVEKMGHKKMLQSMRMEWINEGKPRTSVHEDSLFDEPTLPARENGERERTASRIAPIFEKPATERPKTPAADEDADMDDLYDATPRAARRKSVDIDSQDSVFGGASLFGPAKTATADDGPPEDDLDALLAEEDALQAEGAKLLPAITSKPTDSFDDEMQAMAEMDDLWDI
jgi:replication fork protection complex subunit Csm3/Swi3